MKYILPFYSYNNILNENVIFPKTIVSNLVKKLGDTDEILNMITIFGLFRNQPPFSGKDIQTLDIVKLEELYDIWFKQSIEKLANAEGALKGNKGTITSYLTAYVNNIKSLGNSAKPFSIKNYEETLVDVVNNNGWITNSINVVDSTYSIENPDKKDIVYSDSNILILKGSSKSKCIMYGNGYGWCISQSNLNYYSTYRIEYGASIYFVYNKNIEKGNKEKLCVILRYPKDEFAIADASNSGNRSGGQNTSQKGFGYIENSLPWLKGMDKYFPYLKVTKSEKEYLKYIKTPFYGDDLKSYINGICSILKMNGEEIDAVDFLRDYSIDNKIKSNQIDSLDDAMINQLVEAGANLDNDILMKLKPLYKVRYAVIKISNKIAMDLSVYTEEEIDRVLNNIGDKRYDMTAIGMMIDWTHDIDTKYLVTKKLLTQEVLDEMGSKNVFMTFLKGIRPDEQIEFIYKNILPLLKNEDWYYLSIYSCLGNDEVKLQFFKEYLIDNIFLEKEGFSNYVYALKDNDTQIEMSKILFDKVKNFLYDFNVADEFSSIIARIGRGATNELFEYMKPFFADKANKNLNIRKILENDLIRSIKFLDERNDYIYNTDIGRYNRIYVLLTDDVYFDFFKDAIIESLIDEDDDSYIQSLKDCPYNICFDICIEYPQYLNKILYYSPYENLGLEIYKAKNGDYDLETTHLLLNKIESGDEKFNIIFPYMKDKLYSLMVKYLLVHSSKEMLGNHISLLIPYIKDEESKNMLLQYCPKNIKAEVTKKLI